jgi:hypothetical protein
MKKLLLTTMSASLYVGYILAPFLIVYHSENPSGGTITLKKNHVTVYNLQYKKLVNNKNKRDIILTNKTKR